jgi:hypothetical protein
LEKATSFASVADRPRHQARTLAHSPQIIVDLRAINMRAAILSPARGEAHFGKFVVLPINPSGHCRTKRLDRSAYDMADAFAGLSWRRSGQPIA